MFAETKFTTRKSLLTEVFEEYTEAMESILFMKKAYTAARKAAESLVKKPSLNFLNMDENKEEWQALEDSIKEALASQGISKIESGNTFSIKIANWAFDQARTIDQSGYTYEYTIYRVQ